MTRQRRQCNIVTDACFYTFSCRPTAKMITTLMNIYYPEFVWFICVQFYSTVINKDNFSEKCGRNDWLNCFYIMCTILKKTIIMH